MSGVFDAIVAVSLEELLIFGQSEIPRDALSKHLLAVAVTADPGNIDISNAVYHVVGSMNQSVVFKVSGLQKLPPKLTDQSDVDKITNDLELFDGFDSKPKKKKGLFRDFFKFWRS